MIPAPKVITDYLEKLREMKEFYKQQLRGDVDLFVNGLFGRFEEDMISNFIQKELPESTKLVKLVDVEADKDLYFLESSEPQASSSEKEQSLTMKRKDPDVALQSPKKSKLIKLCQTSQPKETDVQQARVSTTNSLSGDEDDCSSTESLGEIETDVEIDSEINKASGTNQEASITAITAAAATATTSSVSSTQSDESLVVTEDMVQKEMSLNKAMFCIFFDGEHYFLCDIEEHRSKKNVPFYKVYNVGNFRLLRTFTRISDFVQFLIKPINFQGSFGPDQRALVAREVGDDYLEVATIKRVYENMQQVKVLLLRSGKKGFIHFDDIFILPDGVPVLTEVTVSYSSLAVILNRKKSIMDNIYNRWAEHKFNSNSNTKKGVELEGVWRWADKIGNQSFRANKDDQTRVYATTYNSVWKNNRVKFTVGDDVVIWQDFNKDNDDGTPSWPIIGQIKKLYENVASNEKQVQFYWYIHPGEKERCHLRQLEGALFLSTEYTSVDVDFLLGKVEVMPLNVFQQFHAVSNVEAYREALVENPFRTFFNVGKYDYRADNFIFQVDLLKREKEFFKPKKQVQASAPPPTL